VTTVERENADKGQSGGGGGGNDKSSGNTREELQASVHLTGGSPERGIPMGGQGNKEGNSIKRGSIKV